MVISSAIHNFVILVQENVERFLDAVEEFCQESLHRKPEEKLEYKSLEEQEFIDFIVERNYSMDNNIIVINIRDFLSREGVEKLGKEYLENVLSEFSCTKNLEVENFLKNNAVEFAKKNQSVTYLVFSKQSKMFLGYFTIAVKPLSVNETVLSQTVIRKIKRVGKYDEKTGTYTFSAYLIAQLGKNFNCANGELITGDDLLKLAFKEIKEIQYKVGGTVAFLETEDNKKLLDFYIQKNNLKQFANRKTEDHKELIQVLKLI